MSRAGPMRLVDQAPARSAFLSDVLSGLRARERELPCKYFYDERGARLFEQICELPEYYLTRAERSIMERHVAEMAAYLGEGCLIIEPGSGSGRKTDILLSHLPRPVTYVPVDISREQLLRAAAQLEEAHPDVSVLPVCADFVEGFDLPHLPAPPRRRVVYFPGSTIGNFDHEDARRFLAGLGRMCGAGGGLLIGVDLKKDVEVLLSAYNDASGVTAEFNLNLLMRINRELHADFDRRRFRHLAHYNQAEGCIEMYLVCTAEHLVSLAGERFLFRSGERILTERSYKYAAHEFSALAAQAGWSMRRSWIDEEGLFCVHYLEDKRREKG